LSGFEGARCRWRPSTLLEKLIVLASRLTLLYVRPRFAELKLNSAVFAASLRALAATR
jgi:hypothetical protein